MRHWFRHHWQNVRVTHMAMNYLDKKTLTVTETGDPTTLILQRCECGAVRTIRLDGHWTLADLGDAP